MKTRFPVALCQPARARALLQVEIVTDAENPSALTLGAFIPSRATRSRIHSFHFVFFHNSLPRVYRRNEKVMSEPPFEPYPLIAFDIANEKSQSPKLLTSNRDRDRPRKKRSRKNSDFFFFPFLQRSFTRFLDGGRNFSTPTPRRMALVYCLQLNNIT